MTIYKQFSCRELEDTDWYLHTFNALGEAAATYAQTGYEQRCVYAVSQPESNIIAYAIYFPQMQRLGIQDRDTLYWSDGVKDVRVAIEAWVQSPNTWANVMVAKE